MELDIPHDSILYSDGAYNCFDLEDILKDEHIQLAAKRGTKAKNRVRTQREEKAISSKRQTRLQRFILLPKATLLERI